MKKQSLKVRNFYISTDNTCVVKVESIDGETVYVNGYKKTDGNSPSFYSGCDVIEKFCDDFRVVGKNDSEMIETLKINLDFSNNCGRVIS